MIAGALDDRDGARIAHGKALAGDAAEIAFAFDRAVKHGIADDDRLFRHDAGICRRAHDDAAAGKPLADIVVGVAIEFEGHAAREKRAEALSGGAGELRHDGVVRQAIVAVALGDFAGQHGAGGAVGIFDRQCDAHRRAAVERRLRLRDQLAVEDVVDLVILPLAIEDGDLGRHVRLHEQLGEVEAVGLGVRDQLAPIEHLHLADHLVEGAVAHRRHQLAHFLGDEEEIIDDVLGLAGEALAQHRVLGGDADRAGVEMALAHHDAAGGDQRRGGEAEFVGAEQRADHDVAAGADAAVDLHGDAAAQPVGDQRLVGLGKPDLPRRAGMLDRGQRRRAGAALVTRRW